MINYEFDILKKYIKHLFILKMIIWRCIQTSNDIKSIHDILINENNSSNTQQPIEKKDLYPWSLHSCHETELFTLFTRE